MPLGSRVLIRPGTIEGITTMKMVKWAIGAAYLAVPGVVLTWKLGMLSGPLSDVSVVTLGGVLLLIVLTAAAIWLIEQMIHAYVQHHPQKCFLLAVMAIAGIVAGFVRHWWAVDFGILVSIAFVYLYLLPMFWYLFNDRQSKHD